MNKQVIYFIEYKNSIKFFGDNGDTFEMWKNELSWKYFTKIKNQFIFKNLLTL